MNILMVTSEAVPFSKSGGLADVVGALPPALNQMGHDCRIIVPAYNLKPENAGELICHLEIELLSSVEKVEIRLKSVNNTKYYMVCHPSFGERIGIYGDTSFEPYSDNFERFTILSKAAMQFCKIAVFVPDIIHCHDWTTGLLPYFVKESNDVFFKNTKTVFTIHNLAYQGIFPRLSFLQSNVKPKTNLFRNNQLNMLQSALYFADYITTVSPTYAKEIQNAEQGAGLDQILVERKDHLCGIINGIDINEWNPSTDKYIENHFSSDNLEGKAKTKEQLQRTFNLPVEPNVPVFAMISRLAGQKGFDALLPCLEEILETNNVQFVIIGTGDHVLETKLRSIGENHKNISVNITFSNPLAHLAEAGSDFFLMPSRYEPCGLNQLYSLRYGTIPVARRTGGLADSIIDVDDNPKESTGLLFNELSQENLKDYVKKAIELYCSSDFRAMIIRAMNRDYSWINSAKKYEQLFEKLITNKEIV